ncbi:MAG: primosomal protein N' [Firmicutes bacterium]|nr:primosomal protein N' [Bacillota bacterium]
MSELDEGDYVEVVLDDAPPGAGGVWTYLVPPELRGRLGVGQRVEVPFGPRVMEGTVVGWGRRPAGVEVRPVRGPVPGRPALPPELVNLALALADEYLCTPAAALRAVSPPGLRVGEWGRVRLLVSPGELGARAGTLRSERARRLAALLAGAPRRRSWTLDELEEAWEGDARSLQETVRLLARHGLLRLVRSRRASAAAAGTGAAAGAGTATALEAPMGTACRPVLGEAPETVVIWGRDAWDRAQVYLEMVEEVLSQGGGAIVLAPEVEQVERLAGWWRPRLGGKMAVFHAVLTPARRQAAWMSLARGEARVALGTRSAVFAPLDAPALVVLEREHDEDYKQEEAPRYHAARVGAARAAGRLVLGSATPRVETFFRAEGGEYRLRELPRGPLPPVTVVDLRPAWGGPRRGSLSAPLKAALARVVARRQRAVLFLNRRGYAGSLACRECGQALACPRCRVALVFHRPGWLYCHLCGFSRPVPDLCPFCGGRELGLIGTGTQKVEQEVERFLPGTPVFRLDTDAVTRRADVRALWDAFLEQRPAVLVGTQMVAGGPEFPDLGLVGVVNADVGLHLPDFRAAERTFALLHDLGQLAADWGGEVVLQTYHPDHHVVRAARAHDYRQFYREEIAQRRELAYPPFSHLVRVICAAPQEDRARRAVEDICGAGGASGLEGRGGVEVLGPAPAPLSPLRGWFRWVVVVRGPEAGAVRAAVREALSRAGVEKRYGVRLTVDVDPYDML